MFSHKEYEIDIFKISKHILKHQTCRGMDIYCSYCPLESEKNCIWIEDNCDWETQKEVLMRILREHKLKRILND